MCVYVCVCVCVRVCVCVLGGQRCDKGVNERIFWKVLNITAKLSQECFAENYQGIRTFALLPPSPLGIRMIIFVQIGEYSHAWCHV